MRESPRDHKPEGLVKRFLEDESGKEPSVDAMVQALRATLTGMTLYGAMPSDAAAADKHSRPHIEQRQEHTFSKEDFALVAKNVFFEASLEGPAGQIAVMQVTFARLASNRWGTSVNDVVYAKHQFSWTADEKKLEGAALKGVQKLTEVLMSRFKGKSAEQIVAQLSAITGLPADTFYYKRADWNENDPHETRMTERTKRVFQSLLKLKTIGNHMFYKDPPREARVEKRHIKN